MSYQVLARKYRPRSFRELVGQEHVARALINALDQDRLHHAYLFTGTRGVGKTTIARILAKCLNCETGISSEPCGVCTTCTEINEGRFVDLIEIDAASRTKVEDTRELLDNVQYAPTRGRYKVYLIDEVHMLSNSSFNALLKTLEEPPPHVKFLLATTDPQKLPATVLSRCLQFSLKAMSPERVVEHLKAVLQKEVVQFDEGALWELGRAANGSMRDALSLTDQAIAFGNGRLETSEVRAMLGTIDRDLVFRVLEAVGSGDAAVVLAVTAQLAEQSVDFAGALTELISALHHVALAQIQPDAVDNGIGERERILALAAANTAEDIQLYYQIAIQGRRDMPYAADMRSGFEMTLLRMLAFRPVPSHSTNGSSSAGQRPVPPRQMSQALPAGGGSSPRAALAAARETFVTTTPAPASQPQQVATPVSRPQSVAMPVSNVVALPVQPVAVKAELARVQEAAPVVAPVLSATNVTNVVARNTVQNPVELCSAEAWESWVCQSDLAGHGLNLARHVALIAVSDNVFELQVSPRHELIATTPSTAAVIAEFQKQFPLAVIRLTGVEPSYKVPAQIIAERKQQRQQETEISLRADPVVQTLIREFQAEIMPGSIVVSE